MKRGNGPAEQNGMKRRIGPGEQSGGKKEERTETGAAVRPVPVMNISVRSFLTAIVMLCVLAVFTYVLTFLIPGGQFERTVSGGKETVVPGTFVYTEGGLPFWKWLLSPLLVLGAEGNGTVIAILLFLLVVGGVFHCLDMSGLMRYLLDRIREKFQNRKYGMLCLVTLFFMSMGAFVGSFEESVPLVPIAVALALSFGWDELVGLGMSLLAIGCGFATGVCNPFTVGIAQELCGLPMFSGAGWRLVSFAAIYGCLLLFLLPYAKRIERHPEKSALYRRNGGAVLEEPGAFRPEKRMDRGLLFFTCILGCGVLLIFTSSLVPFLQSIIMPLVAIIFLAAGLSAVKACGMTGKEMAGYLKDGAVSMLPAVLLILMASAVKYVMVEANILDTILYQAAQMTAGLPRGATVLFLYLLVLVMNFFIASGSAKAFLLMPLIAPIADMSGISRQIGVLAFAFGDGFSNVFYFTNPVLLIGLGLAGVGYGAWVKWSAKFQAMILLVSGAILLCAQAFG